MRIRTIAAGSFAAFLWLASARGATPLPDPAVHVVAVVECEGPLSVPVGAEP